MGTLGTWQWPRHATGRPAANQPSATWLPPDSNRELDAPTSQLDSLRVARAAALADAKTVPVPRATPLPASPPEPDSTATTDLAYVRAAVAEASPASGDAVSNPPARHIISARKALWIAVIVILLGVLVTAAILGLDYGAKKLGPRTLALEYANAIVQGKVELASTIATHPNANDSPLLTDAAYAQALDRPMSARVLDESRDGSAARVKVEYTLANGDTFAEDYHFAIDGKAYLVLDAWAFDPFDLGAVAVSSRQPGSVSVAGQDVTSQAHPGPAELAAYPGSYPIEYLDATGMFGSAKELAVVRTANDNDTLNLAPEPTEEGRAKVQEAAEAQVKAAMDECVASELLDPICGAPLNEAAQAYEGRDVTMSVADYPAVEVRFVDGEWSYAALQGLIAVNDAGTQRENIFNSVGTLDMSDDGTATLQPKALPSSASGGGPPSSAGTDL